MPKFDPVEFGRPIIAAVKGYVARATEPLAGRIDALEQRAPPRDPAEDVEQFAQALAARLLQ